MSEKKKGNPTMYRVMSGQHIEGGEGFTRVDELGVFVANSSKAAAEQALDQNAIPANAVVIVVPKSNWHEYRSQTETVTKTNLTRISDNGTTPISTGPESAAVAD